MRKYILKTIFYIIVRYILFLVVINSIYSEVKMVKWSDLQSGEDWFMFVWLLFIPLLIEIFFFTLPFAFGIRKCEISKNRISYFFLFGLLFLIEFILNYWFISMKFIYIKVLISVILFVLFFMMSIFKRRFKM